jgi:hypothetical protein
MSVQHWREEMTLKYNAKSGDREVKGRLTRYMGKAAEYAVASQLSLRQITVFWPSVDDGCDLMTANGCRIQVKSSYIDGQNRKGEHFYWFPFPQVKYIAVSNQRCRVASVPKLSLYCDVVVCWGIEENRFWVIPSSICDGRGALVLGYDNTHRFSGSIEAMREMRKLGYTNVEIGKKYNVAPSNVSKYINDVSRMEVNPSVMSLARACENAWENIIDFGTTKEIAVEEVPTEEKE